jgi:hypothetical protein
MIATVGPRRLDPTYEIVESGGRTPEELLEETP